MQPKVSVIIPAYNVESQIARCLDSVVLQTYLNKEVIIVDDGSKDKTFDICKKYAKNYSFIKLLHKKNSGVSSARNAALDIVEGEYIVFIDSDDTVDSEYIAELMQWSNFDFVTAGYKWQSSDMIWHERCFEEEELSQQQLRLFPSKYIGKYYFGSPWATLMKKSIIEELHLRFDEKIQSGEDTLFLFQYLNAAKEIKILPICGYNYFFYPSSLANTLHKDYWKWKIIVEKSIIDFFNPYDEMEKYTLLNRKFDVLKDLLYKYFSQMSRRDLYKLYKNEFFQDSILYKRKFGYLDDKFLIFMMNINCYRFYHTVMRCKGICQNNRYRLKRILFKIWGGKNNANIS